MESDRRVLVARSWQEKLCRFWARSRLKMLSRVQIVIGWVYVSVAVRVRVQLGSGKVNVEGLIVGITWILGRDIAKVV